MSGALSTIAKVLLESPQSAQNPADSGTLPRFNITQERDFASKQGRPVLLRIQARFAVTIPATQPPSTDCRQALPVSKDYDCTCFISCVTCSLRAAGPFYTLRNVKALSPGDLSRKTSARGRRLKPKESSAIGTPCL